MKKTMKKLLPLFLAVVMSLAFAGAALAATVTVNPPEGTQSDATNTYTIYKIFDATVDATDNTKVSYTLPSGITTPPTGFTLQNGNVVYGDGMSTPDDLTADDITAIKTYVTDNDISGTEKTVTGTTAAAFGDLEPGYYYITTTTGTAVIIKTNNDVININDKNTVPTLDKKITAVEDNAGSISTDKADTTTLDEAGKAALAQVGKKVTYTATITVGKGAKGYVFHDKMGTGLSYNNDVTVTVGNTAVDSSNYDTATAEDDTITITFKDSYTKDLAENTVITVTYTATITSDALTVDAAKNTAKLDYGDENGSNSTPDSVTETYNAKITVTKKDGDGQPLANAGFVIKNAQNKYYKIDNSVVSWVDSIDDATEYKSNAEGAVQSFTGLPNGTYTLVEKTVPAGYNKASDESFTIDGADATTQANREQTATVINKKGGVLPSTGGIGTTIFYIAGSALVLVAGAALFARRVARKQS